MTVIDKLSQKPSKEIVHAKDPELEALEAKLDETHMGKFKLKEEILKLKDKLEKLADLEKFTDIHNELQDNLR